MGKNDGTSGPHTWGKGPNPKSRIPRSHGDARSKSSGSSARSITVISYSLFIGLPTIVVTGVGIYFGVHA